MIPTLSGATSRQTRETTGARARAVSALAYLWDLIRKSVAAWLDDYAPSMGAALAYYTMFSLAPLLILIIAVAGLVFGADAARGQIVSPLRDLIGEGGDVAVQG